jgi:hypothetical protein
VEGSFPPATGSPKPGKTAFAEPVSGDVLVKPPGSTEFVPITEESKIPIGSTVDTTAGTVKLITATGKHHKTQSGEFNAGIFKLSQPKRKSLVTLGLRSDLSGCPSKAKAAADAPKRRKSGGKLFSHAHGHFRSKGHHGAGTVLGTSWLTEELCTGTLFKVTEGTVSVRDFTKDKTVKVPAGHHYLAKAP